MANFEGLIRQALASQNASDPAVRQRVYQSSRNALYRMLEKSGKTDDAIVAAQSNRLEASIQTIEAEFAPPEPIAPEPEQLQQPDPAPPAPEPEVIQQQPVAEPEPVPQPIPEQIEAAVPQPTPEPLPPENLELPETPQPPVAHSAAVSPPSASPGLPSDYTPEPMFPPVGEPAPQPPTPPEFVPQETSPQFVEPVAPTQPPEQPVAIDTQLPPAQPAAPPNEYVGEYGSAAAPQLPEEPTIQGDMHGGQGLDEFSSEANHATAEDFVAERDPGPVYKRKNPLLRRIWPIALVLAILLVILWILYALFALNDGEQDAAGNNGAASDTAEDGTIITLLRPTDLSALVTAGRGTAEIISELNQQMLRLKSVRQGTASGGSAEPILLELERGVLRQIAGKQVTVEFYSKSGGSGPAQFAVQCDIGGDSACGRKRFRVGLQPERSIFSLDIPPNVSTDDPAYLAISTDVTNAADSSGNGDVIDIIHVRLILDE